MRIDNVKTLTELFQTRISDSPRAIAYRQFNGSDWVDYSWQETAENVGRWQKALAAEKFEPGDRVGICLANRYEWMLYEQAALGLGLVVVPLFYNDRPDNMAWCLQDAGARLLFLGDGSAWPHMCDHVDSIERVICFSNAPDGDEKVTRLSDWLPKDTSKPTAVAVDPDSLATIVYTSGTTGRPKGVMLSHWNIASDVNGLLQACPEIDGDDLFLSFLPLSHMLERTVGYYVAMAVGAQTTYARSVLDLAEDMVSQKPTIMVCVPRIFERVYTKVQEGLGSSKLKRFLFENAYRLGWLRFRGRISAIQSFFWPILDKLVGKKVRARFGGRLRFVLIGGAPMPGHLFEVFMGLGINFLHGYGLTETSPAICFNQVHDNEPFSVGVTVKDVEVKLGEHDELMVRGPIVMKGYWNNDKATSDCITDGWFHTGDVAKLEGNRIFITGRVKDIIVLMSGEKISPTDAEQAISADPDFEQVMVIGEGRTKLALLAVTSLEDPQEICDRANKQLHDFPGYAKICYALKVNESWSVENGFMTPTLKIKRNKIEEHHAEEIEAMYSGKDFC
jgi:long-chain acyl-CoA synthetase